MDEASETYSVQAIREAFKDHASGDEWGVKAFYENGLIAALRGEYDKPDWCKHRFSDGTRCRLGVAAHSEDPGLAAVHNYPLSRPGQTSGGDPT